MYVRSKVAKGRTYYQVVEGVRVGARVRQRVVVALGTTADPAAALEAMRSELATLKAGYVRGSMRSDRRLEEYHRRLERLEGNIANLAHILEHKLIGASPRRCTGRTRARAYHEAGHAVARFVAGLKIGHATIEPHETTGGHVTIGRKLDRIEWPGELDFSRRKGRLRRDLEFLCAGAAAEAIDDPERFGDGFYFNGAADGGDFHQALELMDGAELDTSEVIRYLCDAFLAAKEKLRRPEAWCQVRALAERLMEDRWIAGEVARGICRRARREFREKRGLAAASGEPEVP